MSKRLLALLLIVCFVVAIPCQASATNTISSDNNGQEIVAQQKEATGVASTSASQTLTMHYPGEEITAICPSKKSGWCRDSLGYRAYVVVNGKRKYGFVTCGHSFCESTDGYVYAKDKKTKIGKIYDNGLNKYTDKSRRLDFTFVELLPGHEVSDYTLYGHVKLTGMGSPETDMKVFHEGLATQKTESVVGLNLNIANTTSHNGVLNDFESYGIFETYDGDNPNFVNACDSGGVIYNSFGKVLGNATYESSGEILTYYYSGFTRADVVKNERGVYVAHGSQTINLVINNSTLSWNSIGIGSVYDIYYRKGTSGKYSYWQSTKNTTFNVASKGTGYEYIVYCVTPDGNVSVSNSTKYGLKFLAPNGVLVANTSTGKPKISWEHVEGAGSYEIWRCTSSDRTFKRLTTVNNNYYVDNATTKGMGYYYKIKVAEGLGSNFSSEVYTVCGYNPPEFNIETHPNTGKPKLSWKSITGAIEYEVWWCKTPNGTYERLVPTKGTSCVHSDAIAGNTYYYKMRVLVNSNLKIYTAYSDFKEYKCGLPKPNLWVEKDKTTGKPKLNWDKIDGATYDVFYWGNYNDAQNQDESKKRMIYRTSNCSYVYEGAEFGKEYYFFVQAWGKGTSPYSNYVYYKQEVGQPVLEVSHTIPGGKPVISWNKVPEADGYVVEYSTKKDGKYNKTSKLSSNTYSYTHTDATAGTTYYYKVRAVRQGVYSDYSSIRAVVCMQPGPTLTVKNITSSGKPKLSWTSVKGANHYLVYFSTSKNGNYSMLQYTTSTSFTHKNATANKTYYYKVKANNSVYSAIQSKACLCPQPTLSVSLGTNISRPVLSWNKVEGAYQYEVRYSTSKYGTYKTLTYTGSNTYTHKNASLGTTYYYKVRACNSEYSEIRSITCKLSQPVFSVTTVSSTGKPKLTWSTVSGANQYTIYYSTSFTGKYNYVTLGNVTSYTHGGAKAGTKYYYKVQAVCNYRNSINSTYDTVQSITCKYATPTWKNVSYTTGGKPKLEWYSVSGASKYDIYVSTDNKNFELLRTVNGTSSEHGVAKSGYKYYYKIKVSGSTGSKFSSVKSITSMGSGY